MKPRNYFLLLAGMAIACLFAVACGKSTSVHSPDGGIVTTSVYVQLYYPATADQDPLADVVTMGIKVTNDLGETIVENRDNFDAGSGLLPSVPLGPNRTITVEGRNAGGSVVSRGMSPLVDILEGPAGTVSIYFSLIDRFSFTTRATDRVSQPMSKSRIGHTATLMKDGRVLIVGGAEVYSPMSNLDTLDGMTLLKSVEIFDPATGVFSQGQSLNFSRAFHSATLLKDDRVLIAGGVGWIQNSYAALKTIEIFDPMNNTFSAPNSFMGEVMGRAYHSATLQFDGTVLITGGWGCDGGAYPCNRIYLQSAELFYPSVDQFSNTSGFLLNARAQHTATLLTSGKIIVAGGRDGNAVLKSTEIFSNNSFTTGPDFNQGRAGHTATRVGDSQILFTGGYTTAGGLGSANNTIEVLLYTSPVQMVAAPANMLSARALHSATLLNNNLLLVAGGVGAGESTISTAELVGDAGQGFLSRPTAGDLKAGRYMHRATLLSNGGVLLTGGVAYENPTEDIPA